MKKLTWAFVIIGIFICAGLLRLHHLNQKPSDPSQFSWINKAEIYTLGLLMSVVAYPIYPEVSREHLMLYTSFDGKKKRIHDDFFLKSRRVRETIRTAQDTGKEIRLWWSNTDYVMKLSGEAYWESRVALAFNGGWLRVENDKVIARIPIAYPKRAFAPLISVPGVGTLGVQEGLFWVLQQEGWYHTGEVEWIAPLPLSWVRTDT